MSIPASVRASNRFGVTTVASGRIWRRRAVSVSSAAPGSWPLQISTGVDDDVPPRLAGEGLCDDVDGCGSPEHADLDDVEVVRRRRGFDLVGDDL